MTENSNKDEQDNKAHPEKFKLPHHRSTTFVSCQASGVILSGPSNDDMWHMIFYHDTVAINSETMTKTNTPGIYTGSIEETDIVRIREDQARVSLDNAAIKSLYNLLKVRLEKPEDGSEH